MAEAPLLSYADIIGMNYIPASAGIVLSPAEQTLASQAVAIFGFSEMWSDYDLYADDIEALMASTLTALLTTNIPPKENMNNRIFLQPYMGTITAGNPFFFTTAGAWQQNAPTNGSSYHIDDVMLAAGHWKIYAYGYRANNAGILRIDVKNATSGATIDADSADLYNATTGLGNFLVNDFTLADDTLVDLLFTAFGKNASSSSYALPVISFELVRV